MANMDEIISGRLSNVKEVNNRIPWIEAGNHELIVVALDTYTDRKMVEAAAGYEAAGLSVRALFKVEKSSVHAPGSLVTKSWKLFKQEKYPNSATDADKFVDFICQLQGIKMGTHQQSMAMLLKKRAEGGQQEAQLARGVRVSCNGWETGKPNPKTGKRFVEVQFATFKAQDANLVAQTRALLDAERPYAPLTEQPIQPLQQVMAAPPPYAGVPAAAAQPQYAPMQYQQQPQQVQQTVQTAQPVQAAPAGGFLSLLPQK